METAQEFPLLIAKKGPLDGQSWSLSTTLVVGRDPHCEIVIDDRQVSRFHVRFSPSPEGIMLEDLDSKNGTHCNGNFVDKPLILQDGDVIQLSIIQQFIYYTSDATMPLIKEREQELNLRLDVRSRHVWVLNKLLVPSLSALQFHLLQILLERAGQVVSRQDLVAWVWGEEQSAGVSDQALDALIRRLRDRLAEIDPNHNYIVTVRGHGLRFDNPMLFR